MIVIDLFQHGPTRGPRATSFVSECWLVPPESGQWVPFSYVYLLRIV